MALMGCGHLLWQSQYRVPVCAASLLVHHLRTIEQCEGRVLRVLYNETVTPVRIVSVFLDRRMKGKL